ncbi:uncharacterized protein Z520_00746 [Fonsecaea multimorphosa CBS 102226]|uniref:Lipocalin-like domain-containing protein n=1 Tax=Fonsecaea multimorphosa CBS 102226 TaxID=1442371 RepID=A0A0D2L4R8_9EURO|nr:uncharacterized protein Z520_00746 [Fonsecaea multimorphosa CBS 102226]KIY04054.1 hypothetical protein Z520_00746 [Fonsecaea multimorphosa CBS 102226]OAL31888.1 hypothetical protein AYO22_00758 [Fonsecaea multimorphosa]
MSDTVESPPADMASFRSRVVGTWGLVSYVGINLENPEDIIYPMGKECKGQIMYSNDGYMAALLQEADLKPSDHDWKEGTTEELAYAAKKTLAYCGPFYLDETRGKQQKIVHHAQMSVPANWINTLQIRCADLFEEDGQDYIILGPESPTEWQGVKRLLRLKWRKLTQNDATQPPADAKELKI